MRHDSSFRPGNDQAFQVQLATTDRWRPRVEADPCAARALQRGVGGADGTGEARRRAERWPPRAMPAMRARRVRKGLTQWLAWPWLRVSAFQREARGSVPGGRRQRTSAPGPLAAAAAEYYPRLSPNGSCVRPVRRIMAARPGAQPATVPSSSRFPERHASHVSATPPVDHSGADRRPSRDTSVVVLRCPVAEGSARLLSDTARAAPPSLGRSLNVPSRCAEERWAVIGKGRPRHQCPMATRPLTPAGQPPSFLVSQPCPLRIIRLCPPPREELGR